MGKRNQLSEAFCCRNGEFKYDVTNLNTKDAYTDFLAVRNAQHAKLYEMGELCLQDPHGYASKVLPTLPKVRNHVVLICRAYLEDHLQAPTIKCNISELNCGIYIKLMDLEQDRKLLIDAKVKLERAQAELMSTAKQAETDRKRLLASSQVISTKVVHNSIQFSHYKMWFVHYPLNECK